MEDLSSMNLDEDTYQEIIDKVATEINELLREIKDNMDTKKNKPKKYKEDSFNNALECDHEYFDICDEFLETQDQKYCAQEVSEKSKRLATSSESSSINKNSQLNKKSLSGSQKVIQEATSSNNDDTTQAQSNVKEYIGAHSFTAHELLGTGSFGEVYLVEKVSDQSLHAMKVL